MRCWGAQHPSGSTQDLQLSLAPFWGGTAHPGPPRAEQNQCSLEDRTGLKTWLGTAAWGMQSLCRGNLPVPLHCCNPALAHG